MPVYFYSYSGTDTNSKNTVKNTIKDFLQKTGKMPEFLQGSSFHIVDDYKKLPTNTIFTRGLQSHAKEFTYTSGATLPPELNNGQKEIVIKTEELGFPRKLFYDSQSKEVIEHSTMHEIGHMFDDYYGQKDEKLYNEMKKIGSKTEIYSYNETQEKIQEEYYRKKDLSDSEEFKQAWKSDVEKYYSNAGLLEKWSFKDYFSAFDIDISDGLSKEEIEKADELRSEDFAQLFSYAFGADEGNKEKLTKMLPRTFALIKSYIAKYLGVTSHMY